MTNAPLRRPRNPGLLRPADDRTAQFPVMPHLFGARRELRTKPAIDRSRFVPVIGMYGNDTRSNCTSVAIANGINAMSSMIYPYHVNARPIITTSNVLYFYSQSTGFDPGDPSSDRGANPDEVARYVIQHGYPSHAEYLYPTVGEIDISEMSNLRDGLDAFGCINLAVGLSLADETAEVWDVGGTPSDKAGSWGYHLLNLWDYDGIDDTDIVTLLTFGQKQKATWRWVRERTLIAYGHAYRQLLTPNGEMFDHKKWEDYLAECRACSKPV